MKRSSQHTAVGMGTHPALLAGALLAVMLALGACKRSPAPAVVGTDIPVSVIPAPVKVERGEGAFVFNADTQLTFGDAPESQRIASYFGDLVRQTHGVELAPVGYADHDNIIHFAILGGDSATGVRDRGL